MASGRSEFEFIAWMRRHATPHPRVALGIGDDAAILPTEAGKLLVTVDMLMEGVHFTLPPARPADVGRKALAVNLSDIAAMAGRPLAAVLSVALPRTYGKEFARELHRGLLELADEFGVAIAGGDTNSWNGPAVISVTLLGEATERGAVLRSGAVPGDWIMVTGALGGSLGGAHLTFRPRVEEALVLHGRASLHAMIDLSDGLSSDLPHILEESGVGAVLDESAIPISEAARNASDGRPPLDHALGDGEDFELLFTVAPSDGQALLQSPPFALPLTRIGEIVEGGECRLRRDDGTLVPLAATGWSHNF